MYFSLGYNNVSVGTGPAVTRQCVRAKGCDKSIGSTRTIDSMHNDRSFIIFFIISW